MIDEKEAKFRYKKIDILPRIPRLCTQRDCINNSVFGCKKKFFSINQMNRTCSTKEVLEVIYIEENNI